MALWANNRSNQPPPQWQGKSPACPRLARRHLHSLFPMTTTWSRSLQQTTVGDVTLGAPNNTNTHFSLFYDITRQDELMKILAMSVLLNIRPLISDGARKKVPWQKGGETASCVQADIFVVSRERVTFLSRLCFVFVSLSHFGPRGKDVKYLGSRSPRKTVSVNQKIPTGSIQPSRFAMQFLLVFCTPPGHAGGL